MGSNRTSSMHSSPCISPKDTPLADRVLKSRYESDFVELGRLGRGGYGAVFHVQNVLDGLEYACKKVPLHDRDEQNEKVLREVKNFARLSGHRNVVRYYHAWTERVVHSPSDLTSESSTMMTTQRTDLSEEVEGSSRLMLFIQMQLCKTSLSDWLKQPDRQVNQPEAIRWFKQIVNGTWWIHQQGFIHRDIKPANIFLMGENLKLGDFGLSKALLPTGMENSAVIDELEHLVPAVRAQVDGLENTQGVGTLIYASPEQTAGRSYDEKVDIFAMGIVLFELLHPFDTAMERVRTLQNLVKGAVPKLFEQNWPAETELIKSMLCLDPKGRPSAADVLKHELLANVEDPSQLAAELEQKTALIENLKSEIHRLQSQTSSSSSGPTKLSIEAGHNE